MNAQKTPKVFLIFRCCNIVNILCEAVRKIIIDLLHVIHAGPIVEPQCTLYRWMIDRLLYFLRRV